MFLGEYHYIVDEHGRLTLPVRWREHLGFSVVLTRGLDHCLFLFPSDRFDLLARQISQIHVTRADARSFSRYFFSLATAIEPDRQAAITISPELRAYAGIDREVIVVGVNDRIEIWNPQRYRQQEESMLADVAAVSERLGDSLSTPPSA